MKARRVWTTAGRLTAAVAGVLALAGAVPATASAAQPQQEPVPLYRCVLLETHDLPHAVGHHCEAFNSAPHEGPIYGPFVIESPREAVVCEASRPSSGFAQLPDRVDGRQCHGIERPGYPGEFPQSPQSPGSLQG
ncbi:hypothetical protein ACFC0M_33430 [Streptomyces sp. NPDC056149]|uniref:hypothetical protein n=1 Tax=Streptomyces sp. NPDC056149 TaxID=3345728 RepID=UPI0035E19114